jgi:hypothetical protein
MMNNLASFIYTGSQLIDVFERLDWVIERAQTRTICHKMLHNQIINKENPKKTYLHLLTYLLNALDEVH